MFSELDPKFQKSWEEHVEKVIATTSDVISELAHSGLTQEVQGQISNAKKHIDYLIDSQSDKFHGDDNLFTENLPISTTITWDPPGLQAQKILRRHYIELGFSGVEFKNVKKECMVILS